MTLTGERKWQRKALRFSFCSTSCKEKKDGDSTDPRISARTAKVLNQILTVRMTVTKLILGDSVLFGATDAPEINQLRGRGFEPRRPRQTFQMSYGMIWRGKISENWGANGVHFRTQN
jgi:hypothetical protein